MKAKVYIECDAKVLGKLFQHVGSGIYHIQVNVEERGVEPTVRTMPLLRDQVMLAAGVDPVMLEKPKQARRSKGRDGRRGIDIIRATAAKLEIVTPFDFRAALVAEGFKPSAVSSRIDEALKVGYIERVSTGRYKLKEGKTEPKPVTKLHTKKEKELNTHA